jgi:hypothetical protein
MNEEESSGGNRATFFVGKIYSKDTDICWKERCTVTQSLVEER